MVFSLSKYFTETLTSPQIEIVQVEINTFSLENKADESNALATCRFFHNLSRNFILLWADKGPFDFFPYLPISGV